MDASEIYSKRLKRGDISQTRRIHFSNRRWTNRTPWRRSGTENIHLGARSTNSRREYDWLSGRIRRVFSTTSRLTSGWRWSDKRCLIDVGKLHIPPSRWTQSQTLLAERGIIPYSKKIHWRNQNYSYESGLSSKRAIDDYWNIDGSRNLSDPWTGFTQLVLLEERPLDGYMWSGGRLTRKQLTSRPDHIWPELWKSIRKHAKLKEKQKWSNEKLHLEKARKLRGSISSTQRIRNSKKPSRTRVKSWKKTCVCSGSWWIYENAYGKFDTTLSSRPFCRKKRKSLQHYNLVHKFIPMPQAMKILPAKAAVDNALSWRPAAKIMDIISILPVCDGQAADAVSAYTQVKKEDAHKYFKIPKSECPDIWIRLPRHKWPKSWSSMEDPVVPLERNLYVHPFGRTLMGRAIWENPFETWLGENSKLGMSLSTSWKRIILICVCGWLKFGWKENLDPMWKLLNKEVDLGEPTSFLDHVYLGCTPRQCKKAKILWTITEPCSNREFPREKQKNYHSLKIIVFLHGLMIWLVMQSNVWNDIVSWQTNDATTRRSIYSMHRWPPLKEEMKSVGDLSNTCSQIVLKCLYLARIGRPDILWSVNKLARSITKWTKACDKRLNRLISYVHHSCEYKQYCHVGNTAKQCRLWLFQDSDFARDLED